MDVVLDLDLDFFVWPIFHNRTEEDGRPIIQECQSVAREDEVRRFLENRCHLSRDLRISGQQFTEHDEAFRGWRRWQQEGKLKTPFRVIHVDAHADLGAGWPNNTLAYLESILKLPVSERRHPEFNSRCVNPGNYLTLAIACRWIQSLTYVFPKTPSHLIAPTSPEAQALHDWLNDGASNEGPPVGDLPPWCFLGKGSDWWKGPIQLSTNEPSVQLGLIVGTDFEFSGFTHMTVAQSPYYSPEAADGLLAVVSEYFKPV